MNSSEAESDVAAESAAAVPSESPVFKPGDSKYSSSLLRDDKKYSFCGLTSNHLPSPDILQSTSYGDELFILCNIRLFMCGLCDWLGGIGQSGSVGNWDDGAHVFYQMIFSASNNKISCQPILSIVPLIFSTNKS